MLVAVAIAVALASRITQPLEELTAGAQDIAEGHFDRRLDIRSNDELQILAETFNHMTGAPQGERRAARGVQQEAGARSTRS